MIACGACGHANRLERRFCTECGERLVLRCAACQAENEPGERFCGGCGAAIADARAAVPPALRDSRACTPKHLADKILAQKSALEGELKQVTVLLADVKGSMELADSVDPEQWHAIPDRFFQILADGVHRFEGTVNRYTGDGIMALLGAPQDRGQRRAARGELPARVPGGLDASLLLPAARARRRRRPGARAARCAADLHASGRQRMGRAHLRGARVVNCASCQNEIPSAVKFCPACGARVASRCGACGVELREAQVSYRAIGAPAQAEKLERELAQ